MPKETTPKKSNGAGLDFEAQLWAAADYFQADLHPNLKADFLPVRKDLANPPFNMSDWGGENCKRKSAACVASYARKFSMC